MAAVGQATAREAFQMPWRTLLYMYGAVSQVELNGFLETNSVDGEERKREIKTRWLQAAERFQRLVASESGIAETAQSRSLGPEAAGFIHGLSQNRAFSGTFSNFPLSFEEVEIDKMVAGQRTVHLDFVEQVKAEFMACKPDILEFCLNPGRDRTPTSVGRTAPNAFTFSSDNPGLRFLGVYERPFEATLMEDQNPGGQPIHVVLAIIGYGTSTINVYRVGNRLILNNGFHRLYALRSLGILRVPVVVQRVQRPELELPPQITELPRDYLVQAPRPGLMKDFFDEQLVCEVRQRNFLKALQLGWGTNDSRVPR